MQARANCFDCLKNGLKMRRYYQSQVDPNVFYRKESVILTYIDDCVIVSQKQETTTSLIESLNNGPENNLLTDEGDISNYLGFNIKKNSFGTFELSELHLVEKIMKHVGLTVSSSLKAKRDSQWKKITAYRRI